MFQRPINKGLKVFVLVWFGQVISLLGSGLTGFALGLWVYEITKSVTPYALVYVFNELPGILVSPLAGAFADRWNRRWLMIISDAGAGLSTLSIIVAIWIYGDQIWINNSWLIYFCIGICSACKGFQWPAYSAAITQLVPKKHFGRASGMIQVPYAVAQLLSPVLASILITTINIQGIVIIDFITFFFSIWTLAVVRFPQHQLSGETAVKPNSLLGDSVYGLTYIIAKPGLLALTIFLTFTNFTAGIAQVLITPLVLGFAPDALSLVLSLGAIAMMSGILLMSIWGGPKNRVYGILGFELLLGISIFLAGFRPSVELISVTSFCALFSIPMISGANLAIWQTKVPPEIQGRVFAVRGMITWASFPLAYLAAGPLSDNIFNPLLTADGILASTIGQIIGVGPNRGIGLLFIILGLITITLTIQGWKNPGLIMIEKEMPEVIADEPKIKIENMPKYPDTNLDNNLDKIDNNPDDNL